MIPFKFNRLKGLIVLVIILTSTGVMGGYAALQAQSIPLEVKEPLKILEYNSSISLFPGQTLPLNVTVENQAPVSYNATVTFSLNDTNYQQKYVTFSDKAYSIDPGKNNIETWLRVSSSAPAAELELTIGITRDLEPSPIISPSPTTTPISTNSSANSLTPSAILLGAGAKWAAQNGTSVLYINWLDNYNAHHFTDGSNWGPYWSADYLSAIKNTTIEALVQQGFNVTCAADVPSNLSSYNLVVFEAWFAVEPKDIPLVREYLANGGNVVIIGGVPCYFATYSRDMWPYATGGNNLASLQDWFGSAVFVNSGGTANLVIDNPFDTSLKAQNQFYHTDGYSCYALTSMSNDSAVIAQWSDGSVFAFTHEYGKGRVYYQAFLDW